MHGSMSVTQTTELLLSTYKLPCALNKAIVVWEKLCVIMRRKLLTQHVLASGKFIFEETLIKAIPKVNSKKPLKTLIF